MKSLLQFLLLIALVLVGKNVKDQNRLAATPKPQAQPQASSMQAFFVQHVSYKPVQANAPSASMEYSRKVDAVSLN